MLVHLVDQADALENSAAHAHGFGTSDTEAVDRADGEVLEHGHVAGNRLNCWNTMPTPPVDREPRGSRDRVGADLDAATTYSSPARTAQAG